MTAAEFNSEFNLAYNNLMNNDGKVFSAKEKSLLLTLAQDDIFDKYKRTSDNEEGTAHYLAPIKNKATKITYTYGTATEIPNSVYAILPDDHLYTISDRGYVVFNSTAVCHENESSKSIYKIKLITEDYYAMNINNPFKKPYDDLLWKFYTYMSTKGNIVVLIGDSTFSIEDYWLSYYRTYQPIIVPYAYPVSTATIRGEIYSSNTSGLTSELHADVHPEIVERAAQIGSNYSKDQLAYQMKQMDLNINK